MCACVGGGGRGGERSNVWISSRNQQQPTFQHHLPSNISQATNLKMGCKINNMALTSVCQNFFFTLHFYITRLQPQTLTTKQFYYLITTSVHVNHTVEQLLYEEAAIVIVNVSFNKHANAEAWQGRSVLKLPMLKWDACYSCATKQCKRKLLFLVTVCRNSTSQHSTSSCWKQINSEEKLQQMPNLKHIKPAD